MELLFRGLEIGKRPRRIEEGGIIQYVYTCIENRLALQVDIKTIFWCVCTCIVSVLVGHVVAVIQTRFLHLH